MGMKLKEPDKVAFDSESDETMEHDAAQEFRANEFWQELERKYVYRLAKADKPQPPMSDPARIQFRRTYIRKDILEFLGDIASALMNGESKSLEVKTWHDIGRWESIKFILAFDMTFCYRPDDLSEFEDGSDSDYLDIETSFRFDVHIACDKLILAGATLARRIGSSSYRHWIDAMIKLNRLDEDEDYKAVDDIVAALVLLWADQRTWIFMQPPQNANNLAEKTLEAQK